MDIQDEKTVGIDSDEFFENAVKEAEEERPEETTPEEQGAGEQPPKTEDKPQEQILGKTPEEIDELVKQRTKEAVVENEAGIREFYEAQNNEQAANLYMKQIEQTYSQYEQSVLQLQAMAEGGEITPQQYTQAINKAVADMQQLKINYAQLQNYSRQTNVPKVKRANDAYYQKLQADTPDLKDPLIGKYAGNLKEKVYDVGGIDMAKGGFNDYVKDFIVPAIKEAEARGYQKAKNEIQKQEAKAKATSVAQEGNSMTQKAGLRTTDDIENASKEDIVNFVLN